MTGFFICGGGGGGICSLDVQKPGDCICKLSQVLLLLRSVTGESVTPVSVPPAYEGGLLPRNFFSGVEHPFCKNFY